MEQAISGRSKIRNVCIAEVFSRMGIIEQWGTGLQRMIRGCKEYGVREPEFIDMGDAKNGFEYVMNKWKNMAIPR